MANKPSCLSRVIALGLMLGLTGWGINSCIERDESRRVAEANRRAALTPEQRAEEDRLAAQKQAEDAARREQERLEAQRRRQEAAEAARKAARPDDLTIMDAVTVYGVYQQNEVKADSMMKGKRFAVSGKVESIGKDILDTPYVVLRGSELFGIQCMFRDSAEIAKIAEMTPGQSVTIAGVCQGKFGSVIMKECWVYGQ